MTPLLHIAEDPDRTWAEYGEHFLHEARTYASWQSEDIRSAVRSAATTVAELRARGRLPDRHAGGVRGRPGRWTSLVLHPLCGGMPVEEGWRSLRLFCERRTAPAQGLRSSGRQPRRTSTARRGAAGTWPLPRLRE